MEKFTASPEGKFDHVKRKVEPKVELELKKVIQDIDDSSLDDYFAVER